MWPLGIITHKGLVTWSTANSPESLGRRPSGVWEEGRSGEGGEVRSSSLFSLEYSGELCYKFSKVVQLYPYKAACKYITSISTGFNFNHDVLPF